MIMYFSACEICMAEILTLLVHGADDKIMNFFFDMELKTHICLHCLEDNSNY